MEARKQSQQAEWQEEQGKEQQGQDPQEELTGANTWDKDSRHLASCLYGRVWGRGGYWRAKEGQIGKP